MKIATLEHIKTLCVESQLKRRPNKTAKGMAYTNERRARAKGCSFFYAAFVDYSKADISDVCRTLSVKGTADKLAAHNSVTKYKMKKWMQKRKELTTQKS